MKDSIKSRAIALKNHLIRNRHAYAIGAVAGLAVALQQRNRREFDAFLMEKGIDKLEFYNPEYYAELHP
jgi:hypothetical protein